MVISASFIKIVVVSRAVYLIDEDDRDRLLGAGCVTRAGQGSLSSQHITNALSFFPLNPSSPSYHQQDLIACTLESSLGNIL